MAKLTLEEKFKKHKEWINSLSLEECRAEIMRLRRSLAIVAMSATATSSEISDFAKRSLANVTKPI
jgi:hypothetical protein